MALPGIPSLKDPIELVQAQENYKAVFSSGAEANPDQKKAALDAVALASQQLSSEGYELFSKAVANWLAQERAH